MALIKCHECGDQISSESAACVKCGAPVKPNPAAVAVGAFAARHHRAKTAIVRIGAVCVMIAAAVIVIIVIAGGISTAIRPTTPSSPAPSAAALSAATPQKINEAFSECLIEKSKTGQYTSMDGGKSALRILAACNDSWTAWVEDCKRAGDTEGNCTLKSGLVAQMDLKTVEAFPAKKVQEGNGDVAGNSISDSHQPNAGPVTCDTNGDAPEKFDPSVATRIIKWVSGVEQQLKLPIPQSAKQAIELQGAIGEWEHQAGKDTVEWFFRAAVGHGVNAQYESFMITEEPANKDHEFFYNLEAARAGACLVLTKS